MLDNVNMTSTRKKPLRCAIYTRKSHEEGLEQEFNSLDAQREAAEAYIESQRMLGWRELPVPAMSMVVFRHEDLMEFSRKSLEFIAQAKRGKAP